MPTIVAGPTTEEEGMPTPRFTVLSGLIGLSMYSTEGPDPALYPARRRDMGRWA